MSQTVDAKGLSCPQPVLMALEEMKRSARGEIQILVDTDTSRENVSRAAASQGWQVQDLQEQGEGYRIVLKKE